MAENPDTQILAKQAITAKISPEKSSSDAHWNESAGD
jgi:hypothetical protein